MQQNVAAEPRSEAEQAADRKTELTLQDIWNGIAQDQFLPYFQPKVTLKGMVLVGVEALMRWQHPELGLLTAGSFLPLVGDNFLFDDLTVIMLEKSITQCRKWQNNDLDLQVSVNLCADQLLDPGLADRIEAKMIEHGVENEKLIIEISAADIGNDIGNRLDTLAQLRARGFGLSIDDFGVGNSTKEQLQRIPASELKIDRKMLAGAARRPALKQALAAGLDVALALRLKSVAEGVETQEEWELVNQLGCDMAQGFLIARPMSGDDVLTWHNAWSTDPFL
ncbi:MAG TPA: EAL domain-containing protein [Burkholderiales bacterium]|nr:EAL domain-containing protein [Burkholderiales bacterium]